MAEVWETYLKDCQLAVRYASTWYTQGRLTRVAGLVLEAKGLQVPVGSVCQVETSTGYKVEAEVVGFSEECMYLMPSTQVIGLEPGAIVSLADPDAGRIPKPRMRYIPRRRIEDRARQVGVGEALLGRILDSTGRPLDKLPQPIVEKYVPLYSRPFNPMDREPVRHIMDVGIRAINGLLTVGRGQRLGLFAGSGVGKSVLLGMMARYAQAEVVVVGLIGERGREVKDFIENILGDEGLRRSVVIAAPADTPPLMRLHGAAYATAVAEYFREQGKHVLLIMDSLTRYAMAQREIALAIGEPPATKGYPPSVFAKLPQLVERAGNGVEGGGSITAFYTVLSEGDDQQDPIADSARGILDGHFVLSRRLAERSHYPAIDMEASISRVMQDCVPRDQFRHAQRFKQLFSKYQQSLDLLAIGAYVPGGDPELDLAIRLYPQIEAFLQQDAYEAEGYEACIYKLNHIIHS